VAGFVEGAHRVGLGAGLVVAIAAALVLSSTATSWMGLHQIFGAFLLGAVMPWAGAATLRVRVLPHIPALALLVNTRGLTELVVLAVGLQIGLLDQRLYSLMVLMALVTTLMPGLLLPLVYPRWRAARDREPREAAAFAPLLGKESMP
jgi:Kef-type K+ transport system membrane component KefB